MGASLLDSGAASGVGHSAAALSAQAPQAHEWTNTRQTEGDASDGLLIASALSATLGCCVAGSFPLTFPKPLLAGSLGDGPFGEEGVLPVTA